MPSSARSRSFLPILPIKNAVLYPHVLLPLTVGRPSSVAAVESAMSSEEKMLVVFAQRDPEIEEPSEEDLYAVGTKAVIRRLNRSRKQLDLMVQGLERARLIDIIERRPFSRAALEAIPSPDDEGPEVEALHRAVLERAVTIQTLAQPRSNGNLTELLSQLQDPLDQVYLLASILSLDLEKEQAILEAPSRAGALKLMHEYLTHEVRVLQLRQEIAERAASEMTKEQRDYVLRQQLKAIQQELGAKEPGLEDALQLRERIEMAAPPERVKKELDRELTRLEALSPSAPDYQTTRSYLELAAELPWSKLTSDNLDLVRAEKILDADHYGLRDVKDRIVEHLAVLKLNPKARAPILCFVGPPGVGKTSLGESIARAIGRQFERTSLGGLHDEAELRGHRRTYIGAMPGRIIQAIRRAGVRNPLLMLDELDKVGKDFRGDPSAALMEILDPSQNVEFRDNYLDLPFDLSKVFFIGTANTLDTIPPALLDRMETLQLSGYSEEEKAQIARRYLIPRRLSEAGLPPAKVAIPDETLSRIISRHTHEAGVRQLERAIGRIARKIAKRFALGDEAAVTLTPDELSDLLGPERFALEKLRDPLPPGVAVGLAWTEAGGDVLYVEATLLPKGRGLTLTGQLGQVMKESAEAALSHVWSQAARFGIEESRFTDASVHIHVPAGAIPKDGPSAGVTIAAAILSIYSGVPVASRTAMTGEITLSGLVLPVGGIKEKVLAARRSGITTVILPRENERDLKELPDNVRETLHFQLVETVDEVWRAALPSLPVAPPLARAV